MELLGDIESYPDWSSLVAAIDVLDRDADGRPSRVKMRAQVMGLSVTMTCAIELGDDHAALRRIPHEGASDEERFDAAWSVSPSGAGSSVTLRVDAGLDAPAAIGPFGGRIAKKLVDDLLADFVRAV